MAGWFGRVRGRLRSTLATVRFRTSAGAVVLIAAALVVAAVGLDLLLGRALRSSFETSLQTRAEDRVALLENGAPPESVLTAIGDEEFVAVLAADGVVIAQSGLADPTELGRVVSGRHEDLTVTVFEYDGSEIEQERLATYTAGAVDGRAVTVGAERGSAMEPRSTLRSVLFVGLPVLVALAAAVAWRLVGRALEPVDRLRAEVDELAGSAEGLRVTESGTGDELHRLATTMNRLLERIDTHRVEQRRFVADASHELKSPIANLRIMTETARVTDDTSTWTELQRRLVGEADRLQALVDDLLFLARSDEQRGASEMSMVDLDELAFVEAERLVALSGEVAIDASAVQPAQVPGRSAVLERVVRNLLENAVRHATSRVVIGIEQGASVTRLIVDDDGSGVPSEQRDRVFERFARLEDDRARPSGGTGLGLAIVHRAAEDHHGRAWVTDAPAGGARFVVELPNA